MWFVPAWPTDVWPWCVAYSQRISWDLNFIPKLLYSVLTLQATYKHKIFNSSGLVSDFHVLVVSIGFHNSRFVFGNDGFNMDRIFRM